MHLAPLASSRLFYFNGPAQRLVSLFSGRNEKLLPSSHGHMRRTGRCNYSLGQDDEESCVGGLIVARIWPDRGQICRGHAPANGEELLRSLQGLLLPRLLSGRRFHYPLRQLLPAGGGG